MLTDPDRAAMPAKEVAISRRLALGGLALTMLLSSMGTSIANVGLPALADAFQASFQQVQWVVIAYLVAITALIVGAGRLGDLVGRRRLLLGGIALFTVASGACGTAPSLGLLIAARVAQGLGAAVMMALAMALVSDIVPKERTGRAMGMLGTTSAIGTALGPSLGGVLLSGFGWRYIFLVSLPLGIAAFVLVQRNLRAGRSIHSGRREFDVVGTVLLAATLAAYALAMTTGRGNFGQANLMLLAGAAAGLVLFGIAETKARAPLVSLSMLRDPILGASLVMNMFVATVMMATLVTGPFYLSRALGLEAATVGLVMSLGPIISAFTGVLAGRLVDRYGASVMVIAGLATMVAGAAGLSVLPGWLGLSGFVLAITVLTPGYQLFQAANNTAVMLDVRAQERGLVSAVLNLSRNLGLVSGASVMGALFAYGSSAFDVASAAPFALEAGMRFTFAVAASLVAFAIIIAIGSSLIRKRAKASRL